MSRFSASARRLGSLGVMACVAIMLAVPMAGCKTDTMTNPEREPSQAPMTDLTNPPGVELPSVKIADRAEADLVEELVLHRAMYARYLEALVTYYTEHGDGMKAAWARTELNDFRKYVKPYRYILDAEVPPSSLRPAESIAEADQLFNEGRSLMKKGGHGVAVFYNQTTMKQALSKFKELVTRYPTSDKIDDAAFWIGKIHKEYFEENDNLLSIEWYKRSIDWNPATPHPSRFELAVMYDYRMHERENALYWYQQVLEKDAQGDQSNVRFSHARIRQLTKETTRYARGEAGSEAPLPEPRTTGEAPLPSDSNP